MAHKDILLGRDFTVDGSKAASGAIVMDNQIMHTEDAIVFPDSAADIIRERFGWSFPNQRVTCLTNHMAAGHKDQHGNSKPHISIKVPAGGMSNQCTHQHYRSGNHVTAAVRSRCNQGFRARCLPNGAVKKALPEFQQNRNGKHNNRHKAEIRLFRIKNF